MKRARWTAPILGIAVAGLVAASCTSTAEPTADGLFIGPDCVGAACVTAGACVLGHASAQFRSHTVPTDLAPGARGLGSVTFDNCSGHDWARADVALRPSSPADAATWSVGRVELPSDVPQGARVTIPVAVTAPNTPGVYPFTWKVQHDIVGDLQQGSPPADVTVRYSANCLQAGPRARFQSVSVPSYIATGGEFTALVTFANCSTEAWTNAGGDALASISTPTADEWGTSQVALPSDVEPETVVAVPMKLTAPPTPGVYGFAWRVALGGSQGIDEPTPLATITALEPYACPGSGSPARFLREDGVPSQLLPGAGFEAHVTFANCSAETWDGSFHVGAAAPSNDGTWGTGPVPLPYSVPPGYAITVAIDGHAPNAPGDYAYQWTMVHDGAGPLSDPSPAHSVHVPSGVSCDNIQWWNSAINYGPYMVYNWWDTDLNVHSGSKVQIRHDSLLEKTGVYAWGYMPEFTDLVTGKRFRLLHLRPQNQWATAVGQVYPAGYVVGLSGGDTADTGLGAYSTGQHLCVQTLAHYRDAFPEGWDPCN